MMIFYSSDKPNCLIKRKKSIKRLEVDSSHLARHCEESSARKRIEDVECAPNALSKTPSTKGTSSSSIDYTPKSPTSSSSPSTNGYLNSPTSPLPRFLLPPPTYENASIDITLTLSPITPLDVQFNSPSPFPSIFGHPILWNLLEAHEDSCLCCIHNRTLIFGLRDELQYLFPT
ncbi:hypothetical protein Tco_1501099 [Tanacetum coccineum]